MKKRDARRAVFVDIPFLPWANSGERCKGPGMELLIPLNSGDPRPLYEQIYQYIKNEIRCGNLKANRRLPTSRELADHLKVSRSTTQLAYEQLVSEGYLEVLPRKGHFVAQIESILPPQTEKGLPPRMDSKNIERSYLVDFSPRGIDLDSFPFSTWRKISRAVLREEEKDMFLKGESQGDIVLRCAIRDYLHNARGVNCSADQILIGAGNEYLLMLLSQLLGNECGIAMENPTYKQAYRVLAGMGHEIYPVDMDKSGMKVSELKTTGANVAYVMPSRQFPTGIVMPVGRRQELLAWANEEPGRFLIEDDYDSEFRYKGKPVPALQGMDRSGRVIYMGTFSKSIAPAIRVGYMVLPEELMDVYEQRGRFYSSTVSRVDQKILAEFINGGYFERHLNRMREIYKGKHDILLSSLKPLEKKFEITGEFAGLHVLLTGKSGVRAEELVQIAGQAGVKVYDFSGFLIRKDSRGEKPTVLLGYAGLSEDEIREGAELLIRAFGEF